jgi:hypothetical protein
MEIVCSASRFGGARGDDQPVGESAPTKHPAKRDRTGQALDFEV